MIVFVNPMEVSLVTLARIHIFKISSTKVALDILLDAAVETQNVSLGIRSLRKVFATN